MQRESIRHRQRHFTGRLKATSKGIWKSGYDDSTHYMDEVVVKRFLKLSYLNYEC